MNAKRREPNERFENIQYLVVLVLIVRSSIYIVISLTLYLGKGYVREAGNFQSWDVNKDGVLTREEVPAGPRRMFERIDTQW